MLMLLILTDPAVLVMRLADSTILPELGPVPFSDGKEASLVEVLNEDPVELTPGTDASLAGPEDGMLFFLVSATAVRLLRTFANAGMLYLFISALIDVETGEECKWLLINDPARSTPTRDASVTGVEDFMLLLLVSGTATGLLGVFVKAALLCVLISELRNVGRGLSRLELPNDDPLVSVSCNVTRDAILFVSGNAFGLLGIFNEIAVLYVLIFAVFAVDKVMLLLFLSDTGVGLPKRFVEAA